MKELLAIGKLARAGKIIQDGKLMADIGFNIEKCCFFSYLYPLDRQSRDNPSKILPSSSHFLTKNLSF